MMTDTARAIAQAYRRVAEQIRAYEHDNHPREEIAVLAAHRGGKRQAALEIAAWLEERAREYEEQVR